MSVDGGYVSPDFVTDAERGEAVLRDAFLLLVFGRRPPSPAIPRPSIPVSVRGPALTRPVTPEAKGYQISKFPDLTHGLPQSYRHDREDFRPAKGFLSYDA